MAMNETAPNQNQMPAYIAIVSGVVLAVASFLKWASADVTVPALNFSRSVSAKGTEGSDGWITLVLGVLAIVFAVMWMRGMGKAKVMGWLTTVCGILGLGVGLINYGSLDDQVDVPAQFTQIGGKIEASAGIGLWLVLLGGVGVIVGGIMILRSRSETGAIAAPPPAAPPAA